MPSIYKNCMDKFNDEARNSYTNFRHHPYSRKDYKCDVETCAERNNIISKFENNLAPSSTPSSTSPTSMFTVKELKRGINETSSKGINEYTNNFLLLNTYDDDVIQKQPIAAASENNSLSENSELLDVIRKFEETSSPTHDTQLDNATAPIIELSDDALPKFIIAEFFEPLTEFENSIEISNLLPIDEFLIKFNGTSLEIPFDYSNDINDFFWLNDEHKYRFRAG